MKKEEVPIATSFGTFVLEATEKGLMQLEFPGKVRKKPEANNKFLSLPSMLQRGRQLLQDYFKGTPVSFSSLPFDFSD